jgi:chromatin structure-remodeling complex protein RSC7
MPHVPLFTQPTQADISRISAYPILQSFTDSKHLNFVQSTVRGAAAKGLASIEYVFDRSLSELELELKGEDYEAEARLKVIQEAEEWERRGREKAKLGRVGSATVAPTPIS